MKFSGFPAVLFLALLALPLRASLGAISVFDVIRLSQGRYSDAEIIRLIQTTDSRFVLSAEDTVQLREAGVTETGRFAVRAAGRDSKVIFESADGGATDVVSATPADAAAYRAEGRRQVSSETLSSFWAALLNDYWAIAVTGRPPRALAGSREGQALTRLSLAVRLTAGPRDAAAVRAAFDSLGRTDREILRKLPAAVPEDLDLLMRRSP